MRITKAQISLCIRAVWACLVSIRIRMLLVIRLMTFILQDLWYGKLVPSSHQRGKPIHTIFCTFNRGNNRIWKGIPISDCLREEWALENVSSCSGGLKSPWVMIYTAPNCGGGGGGEGGEGSEIRSSVEMLAAPFRPSYKRISLLSLLLFLRDSHFSFSSIPIIIPNNN